MGTSSGGQGERRKIDPAVEAALWTLSNGTCYAPGCLMPVVIEVRPGVYKKNVQVAHIYGVKPKSARYQAGFSERVRDSFQYLLLLCLPHHSAVDDRVNGEKLYPPDLLLRWKQDHEGRDNALLNRLKIASEELLVETLERIFEPPLKRLASLAERLERTGEVNERSVAELRRIISLLQDTPITVNERVAWSLASSADTFSSMNLRKIADDLLQASDILSHLPRNRFYE
jgi:hypothetical protein